MYYQQNFIITKIVNVLQKFILKSFLLFVRIKSFIFLFIKVYIYIFFNNLILNRKISFLFNNLLLRNVTNRKPTNPRRTNRRPKSAR
jgi:hypothetical protein